MKKTTRVELQRYRFSFWDFLKPKIKGLALFLFIFYSVNFLFGYLPVRFAGAPIVPLCEKLLQEDLLTLVLFAPGEANGCLDSKHFNDFKRIENATKSSK